MIKHRTKEQNEILVTKVLDEFIKGGIMKTVAIQYNIPYWTLRSLFARYRKKHGFKNTYHMLATYVIIKERKKK